MKKHCTIDTVDGISHKADLESKSQNEEHTNFDHEHDLTSGIEAYKDHDLISRDEFFDSLKSSIKILDQDQNQIIIKMKYDHCELDKDDHFEPDKDEHCELDKDDYESDKDNHFEPDKDGFYMSDK